jgi:hypothetical protein
MANPKPGDRVRVTFEGRCTDAEDGYLDLKFADGGLSTFRTTHASIEVIEPEYIPGEIYQAADGRKYLRLAGRNLAWRDVSFTGWKSADVGHNFPERPLVRLVPEK